MGDPPAGGGLELSGGGVPLLASFLAARLFLDRGSDLGVLTRRLVDGAMSTLADGFS
jgi:hypothetical protein